MGENMPNMANENYKKLAQMFPNAVTEIIDENGETVRAIDADVLRQEISVAVVEGPEERYQFTWCGKQNSILSANQPTEKKFYLNQEKSVGKNGEVGSIDTENIYIEGDNIDALKLLRKTYRGKIKMIYIDPPYNTGENCMYKNNFSRIYQGKKDLHTDWLNMIYPRLKIAKDLLSEDGVLCCAIDEHEFDTLSLVLHDIFGEEYEIVYVTVVHNIGGKQSKDFSYMHEYAVFVYRKNANALTHKPVLADEDGWDYFRARGGGCKTTLNAFYAVKVDPAGNIIGCSNPPSIDYCPKKSVEIIDGISYVYPLNKDGTRGRWRYSFGASRKILPMLRAKKKKDGYIIEIKSDRIPLRTVWDSKEYDAKSRGTTLLNELVPNNNFRFVKSIYTVYDALYTGTGKDKDAIILDFFSGSATTAHATMELNNNDHGHRKFIMVQLPERHRSSKYDTICDIGEERIRRAGEQISAPDLDIGFRVLSIDDPKPCTSEDLLFQAMTDIGVPLSSSVEKINVDGEDVFLVADGDLIAYFGSNPTEEVINDVIKRNPHYAIVQHNNKDIDFGSQIQKIVI